MVKCEKYGKEKEKDMPSLMWLRFVTIQKMTFIILQMIRSLYQLKGYTQSQCVPDTMLLEGSVFLKCQAQTFA